MTKKQFIRQLMARGLSARQAHNLVNYMNELRRSIESHEDVVLLADAKTRTFVPARVYSYEETFQRIVEGREIFREDPV